MPTVTFDRTTTISFPNNPSITVGGIANGSLSLHEILCSDRIAFGDINTNMFQCELYNTADLSNKKIQVSQVDNGTTKVLFTGWVASCKMDDLSGFRTLVAYDYLYKARKKKIKGWWKSFWASRTSATLGTIWRSLLSYYSISYTNANLICDGLTITKTKNLKKLKTSTLAAFLEQLCEINLCVPKMSRSGVLEFIQFTDTHMNAGDAIDIRGDYTISKSHFEDYVVAPYDKIELYNEQNKVVASAGSGDNVLSIQNNIFLYRQDSEVLTDIADFMLENMYDVSYIPANIAMKVSTLDIHIGDLVRTQKGLCLVCENNLSGSLLVDQSMTANNQNELSSPMQSVGTTLGNTIDRNFERQDFEIDTKSEISVDSFDPNLEGLTGQEGDMYVQTDSSLIEKYCIDRNSLTYYGMGEALYIDEITLKMMAGQWSKTGYYFAFSQVGVQHHSALNGHWGEPCFKVTGITKAGTYKFHAKVAHTCERTTGVTNLLGLCFLAPNYSSLPSPQAEAGEFVTFSHGAFQNLTNVTGQFVEYENEFTVPSAWVSYGYFYFWIIKMRTWYVQSGVNVDPCSVTIRELYIYSEDDPYDETHEIFPTSQYVNVELPNTGTNNTRRGAGDLGDDTTNKWLEIKRISEVDESEEAGGTTNNGLQVSTDGRMKLSLKSNVMRAWVKPDPPQIQRNFNQFCVRYTGVPASGVTISYHGASGWSNTSVKKSTDDVYTIKCGGTRTSGVDYVAYKIEGLTSGKKYYFNFAANIGNGATFGNDNTKGLGVVFNTTGVISTNDWTGDPDTWHSDTLYYSMYRRVQKNYIDFSFTATASTMYMCVVVADITVGVTTTMALTEFVLSESERKYIRNFYLFDTVENEWLQFKPFGTGDGGSVEVSSLSDLVDVSLEDLQNNQILKYNSNTGKWENSDGGGGGGTGNYPDLTNLPQVNSVTLTGNKTSADLGIIITLTQAQYNALSSAEQNDPNKTYYITDASGGGGGGQGAENLSDLEDVSVSSLSGGQILKYDATVQKWKNVAESTYELPIATANTLGGIKVGDRLSISGGILSADDQSYSLPIASANSLGGIKVGQNLSIDQDGTLNASGGSSYTLPTASATTKGGVTVNGHGLFMSGTQLKVRKNDYIYTITFENINILSDYGYGAYERYKKSDENIEGCTVFFMGMSVVYGEDANGNHYTKFDKLDIRDCYIRNTTNSSNEEVFDVYAYVFNGTSVSIKKLVIEVYVIIM